MTNNEKRLVVGAAALVLISAASLAYQMLLPVPAQAGSIVFDFCLNACEPGNGGYGPHCGGQGEDGGYPCPPFNQGFEQCFAVCVREGCSYYATQGQTYCDETDHDSWQCQMDTMAEGYAWQQQNCQ